MEENRRHFKEVYEALSLDGASRSVPPSRKNVVSIIKDIQHLLFPEYFSGDELSSELIPCYF